MVGQWSIAWYVRRAYLMWQHNMQSFQNVPPWIQRAHLEAARRAKSKPCEPSSPVLGTRLFGATPNRQNIIVMDDALMV